MALDWHYVQHGETKGPVTEEQLRELIESGAIGHANAVWHQGLTEWTMIHSIPDLAALVAPKTPAKDASIRTALLWVFGVLVGFGCVILFSALAWEGFSRVSRTASQQAVIDECSPDFRSVVLGPMSGLTKMADVNFDKIDEKTEVRATIEFHSEVPEFQARIAAILLTKAILNKLMADGHHPMQERIFVGVSAMTRVKGVTGATMYSPLGIASYNYNHDSIEFDIK